MTWDPRLTRVCRESRRDNVTQGVPSFSCLSAMVVLTLHGDKSCL